MARPCPTSAKATGAPPVHPYQLSRRAALQLCVSVAVAQGADAAHAAKVPVSNVETPNSDPYIQELLKKTEEKREERAKARLQDYYRRNFKDYFEFQSGVGARSLSPELNKDIRKWLKDNE